MGRALLAALVAASAAAGAAQAQDIALTGALQHPRTIPLAELKAMPATTIKVAQQAGPRRVETTFTGTLLLDVVASAGLIDAPGKSGHLQHVIVPRGSDGYAVAIAMGELDPEFEGKRVLIAWDRDGAALPRPELVVPNDVRAGRAVHDLVAIEVR